MLVMECENVNRLPSVNVNGKEEERGDQATAWLEGNSNRQSQKVETRMVWSRYANGWKQITTQSSPLLHLRKQKQRTAKEKVD